MAQIFGNFCAVTYAGLWEGRAQKRKLRRLEKQGEARESQGGRGTVSSQGELAFSEK